MPHETHFTTQEVLEKAEEVLKEQEGRLINVLEIPKPQTLDFAKILAKTISKLSPLLGNMIEFSTVDILNGIDWGGLGTWVRQDPGFPDAQFRSPSLPFLPGIEIKAWFPFATEITARFKDSQNAFENNNINVALVAWLPDHVIWGKPQIIEILVVDGASVAKARDTHYHRVPDYLVIEPEDTSERTSNLQQTNTAGYKLQEQNQQEILREVSSWTEEEKVYSPSPSYQRKIRELMSRWKYRLDTNYAKLDRIEHSEIEDFKTSILNRDFKGRSIKAWADLLGSNEGNDELEQALRELLNLPN